MALTDHGDHAEWTDGRRTWTWNLPDQSEHSAARPILSAVSVIRVRQPYLFGATQTQIHFLDAEGETLARVAPPKGAPIATRLVFGPAMPAAVNQVLFPPEAYGPLRARGISHKQEEFSSQKQLYDAHPNPEVTGLRLRYLRHPYLVMYTVITPTGMVLLLVIYILLHGGP